MVTDKKIKSIFSTRNRIVYFICGVACIVASFLPYFSFNYNDFRIRVIGVDVISDLSTVWEFNGKNSFIVLLLFILPFYVMILGVIYLFRSFVMSYKIEKFNVVIFKTLKSITVTLTILWVSAVFLTVTLPDSVHEIGNAVGNISFGFYLFAISEVFKFFLEVTIEEVDSVLDTVSKTADVENSEEFGSNHIGSGPIKIIKTIETEIQYYIHNDVNQEGPFSISDLKNKLKKDDYVWYEGLADWTLAKEDPTLKHLFSTTTPPPFKRQN